MFIVSKKNIQTWQTSTSTVSTVPSKKKREDNKMQHEFNSSSECKFFVKSYRTIVLIHFKTGNECSRALLPQLMQLVHLRFLTSWITPLIIINSKRLAIKSILQRINSIFHDSKIVEDTLNWPWKSVEEYPSPHLVEKITCDSCIRNATVTQQLQISGGGHARYRYQKSLNEPVSSRAIRYSNNPPPPR